MAVARRELLGLWRPMRVDIAAAHELVALHLEKIGEIAADFDLEVKADATVAVVGDVDVLMHADVDAPPEQQTQRLGLDLALRGRHIGIGAIDARARRREVRSIQQVPWRAVDEDAPDADEPRVEEEKPFLSIGCDLPVGLAHHHRIAFMHGELRRADLDFETHRGRPLAERELASAARRASCQPSTNKRRAGDVIRRVGGEPHGRARDVVGLADALVGHERHEIGVGRGRRPSLRVDRRADRARRDAVDADAMGRELLGDRAHHHHDSALWRRRN